ncbi:MAG: 50S ribosomal protein L5 [Alistipes sp.]|nr:50S ribosomal protein L5 [Alistipes sp.]
MATYVPQLKKMYKEQIIPALTKEFGYKSIMQVPKLEKIVVNQGLGQAVADKKLIEIAQEELTLITGQKAVPTKSRKDISNFKLRKGMPIGVRVTLRGDKMYEFMQRLVAVALPRVRDFQGINEKFDGRGNYTMGITEQIIFPEIDIDKISKIFGMEITFVTNTDSDEEAYALLSEFGLPFKNAKKKAAPVLED